MVVAVAEESRGADHARPWIEQAKSDYWQLIDTEHRLEDLYNLVNVPQAIWIDEQGASCGRRRTAGSTDHFRAMDLTTRTHAPEDQAERLAARHAYLDAVRAWVTTGKLRTAGRAAAVARCRRSRRRSPRRGPASGSGVWLRANGRAAEGDTQMAEASRLHPESWSMWRQAADLDEVGKAGGEDSGSACKRWARSLTIHHRIWGQRKTQEGLIAGSAVSRVG